MKRHTLIVTSVAYAGREAEYHKWYDKHHLADMLALPGIVSARPLWMRASLARARGRRAYIPHDGVEIVRQLRRPVAASIVKCLDGAIALAHNQD